MTPTEQIDKYIAAQIDWQSENLKTFRALLRRADPAIEEALNNIKK